MIDVSNLVVKAVKDAIVDYPNVKVYSSFIDDLEKLPGVTCYEVDNRVDTRYMDGVATEHYARVVYEISVYNTTDNRGKQTAKSIFTTIDNALGTINFVRTFKSELPNIDRKVYRFLGRYEAVVSEETTVDGNKIHHVYRR